MKALLVTILLIFLGCMVITAVKRKPTKPVLITVSSSSTTLTGHDPAILQKIWDNPAKYIERPKRVAGVASEVQHKPVEPVYEGFSGWRIASVTSYGTPIISSDTWVGGGGGSNCVAPAVSVCNTKITVNKHHTHVDALIIKLPKPPKLMNVPKVSVFTTGTPITVTHGRKQ